MGAAFSTALVGRTEELDVIRRATERGGCVIGGPAGIGKSRLAAEASRVHSPGQQTMRVLATASAASIPFGAVGHLLPLHSQAGGVVPQFIETLRDHPSTLTLVVDDAHLLDAGTASLVLAVAAAGAARVVVTVRTPDQLPDAITALWTEVGLARIDLQALSVAEVDLLVKALLDGPSHPMVHERIYELSQGNPLFVTEIVHDALRTGALAQSEGRWCWDARTLALPRLSELIGNHLGEVSAGARHTLEILALGGTLRMAHLKALASDSAIDELEQAGLVSVTGGAAAATVEVAHPLYGEVVAAETPEFARARLRRELARVIASEGAAGDEEQLQIATLLLDAGESDDRRFVSASALALRRGAPSLAGRLAARSGRSIEADLARARALIAQPRFDEVEKILGPRENEAAASSPEISAAYLETRFRALLRGTAPGAVARALLHRCQAWHRGQEWSALVSTQEAWFDLYDLSPAAACERVRPYTADASLRPEARFGALAVTAYALSRLGRTVDAEKTTTELERLVTELTDPPWEIGQALLLGDLCARIEAASDVRGVAARLETTLNQARANGDRPLAVMATTAMGALALTRGHVAVALTSLRYSRDGLVEGDPGNAAVWVMALLGQACGVGGDEVGAQVAIAAAEDAVRDRPMQARRTAPDLERARVWCDVAGGRLSSARDRCIGLAERSGEDVTTAADATMNALRLGARPSECADHLESLAGRSQNELFQLYAIHARAVAMRDALAQLDVAERYDDIGLDLLAAEAALGAAAAFKAEARSGTARRAATLAARCGRRCAGARTPGLTLSADAPRLTPREREIASLAAAGMSNSGIAAMLGLSVRSVETYVLRTCRKLGVDNRQDLARITDDKIPPAQV